MNIEKNILLKIQMYLLIQCNCILLDDVTTDKFVTNSKFKSHRL